MANNIERKRLIAILRKAKYSEESDEDKLLKEYENALRISNHGYSIHYRRSTEEIFVNSYNPEWIQNWNANMDFQICLDYFSIITYITDYYTKD